MDWTKGYTASWRLYEVDTSTWADGNEVQGFVGADVVSTLKGASPLIQSGTIQAYTDFANETYLRIVMIATQDGETERVDVATLLCSVDSSDNQLSHMDGRSVLYPASVAVLDHGAACLTVVDAVVWCRDLLANVVNCPVIAEGSAQLLEPYVFDLGSNVLEAVWKVLDAVSFTIDIDGYGTVRLVPLPTEPALTIDATNISAIIETSQNARWFDVPNRYMAFDGSNIATATNDSIDSQTSTVNRGYRVDVYDDSPSRSNGESLSQYAERRLRELSTIPIEVEYQREWMPDVRVGDVVHVSDERVGDIGDYKLVSQSVTCSIGATVTEKITMEVELWR